MELDYGKIVRAALGNKQAPFMQLNIPHGIMNELKRLGNKVEDWQWKYLPRANGMQEVLFQALDETDPNTWAIYNRAGY